MEARVLRWSEVEADCIPAERMKAGKEHVLPNRHPAGSAGRREGTQPVRLPRHRRQREGQPGLSAYPSDNWAAPPTACAYRRHVPKPAGRAREHPPSHLGSGPRRGQGVCSAYLSAMRQHLTTYHQWLSDQRREGEALEAMMAQADEPTLPSMQPWKNTNSGSVSSYAGSGCSGGCSGGFGIVSRVLSRASTTPVDNLSMVCDTGCVGRWTELTCQPASLLRAPHRRPRGACLGVFSYPAPA